MKSIRFQLVRDLSALSACVVFLFCAIVFSQELARVGDRIEAEMRAFQDVAKKDQDAILLQLVLKSESDLMFYSEHLKRKFPNIDFCFDLKSRDGFTYGNCSAEQKLNSSRTYHLFGNPQQMIRFSSQLDPLMASFAALASSPLLLTALIVALVLSLFTVVRLKSLLTRPLSLFIERIGAIANGSRNQVAQSGSVVASDWKELDQSLISLVTQLEKLECAAQEAARVELATQVAHDIRAPLSALKLISSTRSLDAEKIDLMNKAIKRISDIAQKILEKNIELDGQEIPKEKIAVICEQIVSEKKYQYSRSAVSINLEIRSSEAEIAECDPVELGRALSNLIDNAFHAVEDNGLIQVLVESSDKHVVISVVDNGCGIPEHIQSKIGIKGFTYGKRGSGNGLGLYQVKQMLEGCSGQLVIESKRSKGTQIVMRVPLTQRSIGECQMGIAEFGAKPETINNLLNGKSYD